MSTKINRLEIENVKRVKAVTIEPTQNGLTIVGGNNNQGKTSVLDAITWALGGDQYKPSEPRREGALVPPSIHIELSNGLIVERKGVNSSLKVIDPSGNKAGQQLLNEFVEQLALNLPKFMQASNKEKAETLLQIIGVGERLYELETKEQQIYHRRHEIGRIADQKRKYAEEMTSYPDAPTELISASELIQQQQEILAQNGENQRKRAKLHALETESEQLQKQIDELLAKQVQVSQDLEIAKKSTESLKDESTEALERNIAQVEEINRKVRANMDQAKAQQEAEDYQTQYQDLTEEIEQIRTDKKALLDGASLPLPGLSVEDGALTYNGYQWDNMSGSEQLKVATAIIRKLNPNCGFVLLDKLEQMDLETLRTFASWLEEEGLQAIATRVSTGEECSIIIEDGYGKNVLEPAAPSWKAGEF